MELRPEDVSLLERCPHFRRCYIQASMLTTSQSTYVYSRHVKYLTVCKATEKQVMNCLKRQAAIFISSPQRGIWGKPLKF